MGASIMPEIFKNYGERIAAIDENGRNITYEEIFRISQEIVSFIPHRTLIFSLCSNSIGSITGYVSFLNMGIVPLLLSKHIDDVLLTNLIDKYAPEYLWVPVTDIERFPKYEKLYETWEYALLKTSLTSFPMYKELALLLTTSGSTGSPKLVKQSFRNIIANTESIIKYLEIDSSERPITTLPMNYTYGLSIINTHLYVGATLLLTDSTLMQKSFWDFLKKYEATSFGGVPYTYEMLKKLRFFNMPLPSIRYMTQAGGKLSPELHREFAEYAAAHGKKFVVMYGQTEATARMAYLPSEKAIEKYGSMGIAIPGGHFRLIDVDGKEITQSNTTGELVYSGKNVTLGYAESGKDLITGDERHGVLETGDMAQRDEDGFYYIVGRKKRFLKIFGNRVNLDETERMIKTHFPQLDCACGGIDEKMYIFITNSEEISNVRKFIADRTNLNISAFKVMYISKIPKNESGKTLYKELEKLYK